MIKLSKLNLGILSAVKVLKGRATTHGVARSKGLTDGGALHHLQTLKRAGKVSRDKKTLVWSPK